jgi:hypothetical protein
MDFVVDQKAIELSLEGAVLDRSFGRFRLLDRRGFAAWRRAAHGQEEG